MYFKNVGKRLWFTVLVSGAAVAIVFQNCGKAGFDTMSTGLDTATESESRLSSGAPFAFEAAIDHISYLSCASSKTGGKSFTFRFGAYSVSKSMSPNSPDRILSGLSVKRSFIDYAKENLDPTYDPKNPQGNVVTYAQVKKFLSASAGNTNQQLQFSMRKISDLKTSYKIVGSPSAADTVPLLGDLSNDRWLEAMASKSYADSTGSDFINFFPLADSLSERKIEGEMNFSKAGSTDLVAQGMAESYRSEFLSNAQLVLGFSKASTPNNLTSADPATSKKAFGTAYRPQFKQGVSLLTKLINPAATTTYIHYPENTMTEISELNLETSKPTGRTWACDANRRYTIVRAQDADIFCSADTNAFSRLQSDNVYKREMEIVRRHFPAKDWDVSIDRRCLVQKAKNFSCYADEPLSQANGGTAYGLVPVSYDQTKPCYTFTKGTEVYGGVAPTPYCAEVASICVRN